MSNSNNKYKTDTTFKNLLENKNQSTQSSIFSEVSVNSSRFEEAKNNRKLRES